MREDVLLALSIVLASSFAMTRTEGAVAINLAHLK